MPEAWRDGGGVLLETPNGIVRAAQAVIATNSYSDLTPATAATRKAVIPFRSAMIATKPLGNGPGAGLLSRDRSYTETRRMMRWFHKVDDRFVYGGRGAFGKRDSASAFAALGTAMVRQFPELAEVEVTHRWSGLVAMTMSSLPHVGRLTIASSTPSATTGRASRWRATWAATSQRWRPVKAPISDF